MTKIYTTHYGLNPFKTDVEEVLTELDRNPMSAMRFWRQEVGHRDEGYREMLYSMLVGAYGFALKAQASRKLMIAFLHSGELPPRKNVRQAKDILRFSIQFVFSAKDSGPLYNRICSHERALRPFFRERVDPSDLIKHIIEGGGLEELDRRASVKAFKNKLRRKRQGDPTSSPDAQPNAAGGGHSNPSSRPDHPGPGGDDDNGDSADNDAAPEAGPKSAKSHNGGTIAEKPPRKSRGFVLVPSKHLAIHATPEQIAQLTDGKPFRTALLTIKILEVKDGWSEMHLLSIGGPSSQ